MELKTLKDFNREEYCPQCKLSIPIFDIEGLRQEAIKHLKYDRRSEGFELDEAVIFWIKYFFNITEEDLK